MKSITITPNKDKFLYRTYDTTYLINSYIPSDGDDSHTRLQEKSQTITENGQYEITPDNDYDGLSKVNLTINIPSSGAMQILSSGNITEPVTQIELPTIFADNPNYSLIFIVFQKIKLSENTGRIQFQLKMKRRSDDEIMYSATASDYYFNMDDFLGSSVRSNTSLGSNGFWALGNENSSYRYAGGNVCTTLKFYMDTRDTDYFKCLSDYSYERVTGGTITVAWGGGQFLYKQTSASSYYDPQGIRMYCNTGTITECTYKVYGLI